MAKILIAEDDKSVRELFSAAVQSLGHCAIAAENGRLAWRILNANEDISFIICDLAMPEMDGNELIKLVRKDPRFIALPIVIVSSAIRAKEIISLLEQGATWFMAKPVDMAELMDLVKKHFPSAPRANTGKMSQGSRVHPGAEFSGVSAAGDVNEKIFACERSL